eukprot:scaffold217721_cov15-Prasinocladus_malaysianus.AAC.1
MMLMMLMLVARGALGFSQQYSQQNECRAKKSRHIKHESPNLTPFPNMIRPAVYIIAEQMRGPSNAFLLRAFGLPSL